MSILFNCDGCGQSLKVPDGSVGKQVRCPQCEEINIIPDGNEAAGAPVPLPTENPFATTHSQSDNPFAAPRSAHDAAPAFTGELTYNKIDMGDVYEQAWRRYKPNVWMAALFGLIFFGIGIGSGIVGQLVNTGAQLSGEPLIIGLVFSLVFIVQQCISAYQQCMGKRYGLNVARGSTEVLNGIFSFEKVFRVIILVLLILVVTVVVVAVVALPVMVGGAIDPEGPVALAGIGITAVLGILATIFGLIFMFRIFLSIFFIIDRDAGVVDAMKQSSVYMKGNAFFVWLTMFVAGIGAMLFAVFTCGIGLIFAFPLLEVMQSVIYLKATGQYQNIEA